MYCSLKNNSKIVNGIKWSVIDRFSIRIINFIVGIILARMLLPSDYGLIAMLAICISISQAVVDGGFLQALIQKDKIDEKDMSSVFYFTLFISIIIYFLLSYISENIAQYYDEIILIDLLNIIGINFILISLVIVPTAKLHRELNFTLLAKVSVLSSIISGITAIYYAYNEYGVWSLVIQMLLKSGISLVLIYIFIDWKPKLQFSIKHIYRLFSYGSKLMAAGLLNAVYDNIYLFIIGKFYGSEQLGLYARANQFQQLPSESFTVMVQRVSFPVMCKVQNSKLALKRNFRNTIRLMSFIIFPSLIALIVIAKPLVLVLLTEKWAGAIIYIQLLSISGLLYPIFSVNLNILKAKGFSGLFLKLEIFKKLLITVVLVLTYSYGIEVIIMGQIIVSIISFFINAKYTYRFIGYSIFSQIKDIFHNLTLSIIVGIIVYSLSYIINNQLLLLLLSIIFYPIIYYIFALVFKYKELKYLKYLLKIF